MKILYSLYTLVIVLGCFPKMADYETLSKDEMVTNLLNKYFDSDEPGVQYIVVDKNSIVYERSLGLSDVEEKKLLSSNQTMAAFSMTKILTAIAVLHLVEQGKVQLNDRVDKYINHPYASEITVRQLLIHTSGIPNPIPLKWVHLASKLDDFVEKNAFNQVLKENSDLDSQPGSEYQYSNIGYWLLGKVIEKASREKYTDYVTKNLFEPLKLTPHEIGFLIVDENNHAKGYLKKWSFMNLFGRFFIDRSVLGDYEGSWLHIKNVYVNGPSFGGAIGSAKAFSRILQDLLSEKSKLLEEETKRLLYSQQKTDSDNKIDMTLGWHIDNLNGITYYYKEGGGAGFHSEMRIYPEKGLASVLMTNRTSFNSRKSLSELDINFVAN